jgi:PAS domain S-box-containing protein
MYVKAVEKRFSMKKEVGSKDFEKRFQECNDKFDTIFKLTSAASKIIGSDLTILKANDALSELMGYSVEEIEGTKILDHACEEYKQHWHDLQMALWSKKVPFFKLQACLHKKDRSLVWVNVTTILFQDEGETFGFTVLDDYTDLKRFEESEKRLNMALKYSHMAVWELDLKSNTVYRSEGHDEIFGYDRQLETWNLETYFPHLWEEDLPQFREAVNSLSEGIAMDLQVRLVTQDGSVKWVNFQGKTETDASGKPLKILGTINDITKDKLIERHKDDFISIASHELKTPITSLKTSIQLLDRVKDGLADRTKTMILLANKSVNKIALLVDDLLNASKSNNGQLDLKKTAFNLHKLVEECCTHLHIEGSHTVDISGPEDLQIIADAERIERVIVNFLNNAVKYAQEAKHIRIQNLQQQLKYW